MVEDKWLTGTMVPLISKHLNLSKWRSIMASFHLSTKAVLAETRLIVKGKLTELEQSVGTVRKLAIKPKIVDFKSVRIQVNQGQSLVPEWYKVKQRMIH